jgi:hypothetical protein
MKSSQLTIYVMVGFLLAAFPFGHTIVSAAPPAKEDPFAGVTQNWDKNLPSGSRFTVLPSFKTETVRDNNRASLGKGARYHQQNLECHNLLLCQQDGRGHGRLAAALSRGTQERAGSVPVGTVCSGGLYWNPVGRLLVGDIVRRFSWQRVARVLPF